MADKPKFVVTELVPESAYKPNEEAALNSAWKDAETYAPDLWKRCYPRIYNDYKSNEYYSPKEVARQMFSSAMKVEMEMIAESEQIEIMWASRLAQYRVPIYWVTRDMVEAVQQTVPPIELDWYNMPMPFPAAAFMLPKGAIVHPKEGNVRFVSYTRNHINEFVPTLARTGGAHEWASSNGAMILFANTEAGFLTHWNIPYDYFPTVNLADLDNVLMKYEDREHSTAWASNTFWPKQANMTHDDTILGARVAHLIFGLLLLMTRKPSLVKTAQLEKRVVSAGKAPKEFWSPAVIGEGYKIRRLGPSLGGTHASPRGHWVRGYWRDQMSKPDGKPLIQEIWIEPYWRGGE